MIKKLKFFSGYFPVLILIFVEVIIFLANYQAGNFLLGWDNTAPELNLDLNLMRFLSSVWQEYRGLGTLDGMAHGANLVHWLLTYLLSKIALMSSIRYMANLLLHFLGGLGTYFLSLSFIKNKNFNSKIIALFAALFYLLNPFTIQMFYLPLELFSYHFVALPWGIYGLKNYLDNPSKKHLFALFVINLLISSQAHVPTLFIVYAFAMAIYILFNLLQKGKKSFKLIILAIAVIFASNAYWGLAYTYSTISKSAEISSSKQNRFGTSNIFYKNEAWGDFKSIITFQGFRLDYQDWNLQNQEFQSVLEPWQEWMKTPLYQNISYFFSGLILLGFLLLCIKSFKNRDFTYLIFPVIWIFALMMLGTNIPILSIASQTLREQIPFFFQIFRFTFTKFSLLYVFSASIILSYLLNFLNKKISFKFLSLILLILLNVGIISLSFPTFQNALFYKALKIEIPESYFQLKNYLEENDPDSRVATLPAHSFWGWTTNTNNWGYRGSGFLWQMLPNPILDRSFDPWSKYNETFYWQLSQSIYTQDKNAFINTLNKYDVGYLLLDESIFHPGNYETNLFIPETKSFLRSIDQIELVTKFDNLSLYKITNSNNPETDILTPDKITRIDNNYQAEYTKFDQAFTDNHNYINSSEGIKYPFSYLQQEQLKKPIEIKDNYLIFPIESKNNLIVTEFAKKQKRVLGFIKIIKDDDNLNVSTQLQIPKLELKNGEVLNISQATENNKIIIQKEIPDFLQLNINEQVVEIPANKLDDGYLLNFSLATDKSTTFEIDQSEDKSLFQLEFDVPNILERFDKLVNINQSQLSAILIPIGDNAEFTSGSDWLNNNNNADNCNPNKIGSVEKTIHENKIFYSAKNKAIACDNFSYSNLDSDFEYIYELKGNILSGQGVKTYLLNPQTKHFDIEAYSENQNFDIWHPLYSSRNIFNPNSDSYQLNLQIESFKDSNNEVEIYKNIFYPVPLSWLNSIHSQPQTKSSFGNNLQITNLKKSGTYKYTFTAKTQKENSLFVLSQSYDKAWLAFANYKLLPHYEYNGWANAWMISDPGEYEIIIIFWPQLLSFFGYFLLMITFIYFAFALKPISKKIKNKDKRIKNELKNKLLGR